MNTACSSVCTVLVTYRLPYRLIARRTNNIQGQWKQWGITSVLIRLNLFGVLLRVLCIRCILHLLGILGILGIFGILSLLCQWLGH